MLAADGRDFQAEDLNSGEVIVSAFPNFPDHFGFGADIDSIFAFI